MNPLTKMLVGWCMLGLSLAFARTAQGADCVTDMDCPGSECGGQVCQWISTTSHVCQPAGSRSRGSDGWCNTLADCKCQALGARCNAQFSCSFVQPSDAPPVGGAGGTSGAYGGASGAAGSGGLSVGTSGSSGAASANGGTANTAAGGTAGAGGSPESRAEGPITGAPSAPEAAGCELAAGVAPRRREWLALGSLAAACLLLRRRAAR